MKVYFNICSYIQMQHTNNPFSILGIAHPNKDNNQLSKAGLEYRLPRLKMIDKKPGPNLFSVRAPTQT